MEVMEEISKEIQRLSLTVKHSSVGQGESECDESDDDGPLIEDQEKEHPLQNNLVLIRIFQFLNPHTLLSCRGVCMKWNQLTIPIIRHHFEISVYSCTRNETIRRSFKHFVKLMSSNTLGIPFTKFRLGSFYTEDNIRRDFIQLCGGTAIKYDLSATRATHSIESVSDLLRSSPKLESFVMPVYMMTSRHTPVVELFLGITKPKLTSLKSFGMGIEDPAGRKRVCPSFFEEFFKVAENVSSFHLWDSRVDHFSTSGLWKNSDRGSLEVIKVLEGLGREPIIKHLTLSRLTEAHVVLLKRMAQNGLKLEKLGIDIGRFGQRDKDLLRCAEIGVLFKDDLTDLRLSLVSTDKMSVKMWEFPSMPRLKHLDLKIAAQTQYQFDCLKRTFPNLETLRLEYELERSRDAGLSYGTFDIPQIERGPSPNLKTLSLSGISLNSHTFELTLNTFPNLTSLELDVAENGEEILITIWTQMPKLERLSLSGTLPLLSNIDTIVTGISMERIEDVVIQLGALEEMTPEIRNSISKLVQEHSTLPSIRNLRNLRYLRLSLIVDSIKEWRTPGLRITDVSGHLGLYSLQRLEHLFVRHSEFSETCSEILVKDLGLDTWIIRRNEFNDIIPSRGDTKFPTTFTSEGF